MSILSELRGMLIANGLDADSFSDEVLNSFILEAKLLIDEPYIYDSQYEDYEPEFKDEVYTTEEYPVKPDSVIITIDGKRVTPSKITKEGVIYLGKTYNGVLNCTYIVGLGGDDITLYFLPIVIYLIKENTGGNLSSINEGDISISYDTANNTGVLINNLVQALKNRYNGRVVFI